MTEVKAPLDAREATVGELESQLRGSHTSSIQLKGKLFSTDFANKVLLKDDERDKKENATLEQKLSQYKQAHGQVQKKNSSLVLKL